MSLTNLKKIGYFLGSLYCIYFFCFSILPFLDRTLGFQEAHDILIEEKIEAGAWYYIFVEKVGPSSENVRHSLMYNPRSNKNGQE